MILAKESVKTEYINIYSLSVDKLGIPIFQRFFDWKKSQTNQLLSDIVGVASQRDKDLYLLDFIFYAESGKKMIADGQQRIVTLNLLFKVINDYIAEHNLSIEKLRLFDITYDINEYQSKYFINFNRYICTPFKSIYLHFTDWIKENSAILDDIVQVLKFNIKIYLKQCDNADDAFRIFQEINTGGKPLSKDEIIQTAIQQYSRIYAIPLTFKVKDIKLALVSYYKYLTGDTSTNFDNISILSFLKNRITKDQSSFQKFVKTLETLANLEGNPIASVFNWINRTSLYDVVNVLAMRGIDTTKRRDYLDKVIMPLSLLSIELSLTGGLPSILKYLMNDIISMINNNDDVDTISMSIAQYINANSSSCKMNFTDFVASIGGSGNATPGIKKALLLLDVIISNTSGTVNVSKINLEHIYPQTPKIEWASKGWPTNREDQKTVINNVGNQFLLCESVNKSISNKYIQEKIVKYSEIIARDALLRTRMNSVDFTRFESERETYVIARQKEIASYVYNTFPFAKVIIINNSGGLIQ